VAEDSVERRLETDHLGLQDLEECETEVVKKRNSTDDILFFETTDAPYELQSVFTWRFSGITWGDAYSIDPFETA